ncbi:hypothetical protein HY992_04250 [Candidatus Micrarchaeota archaeon]|nr:hypothetical protein [Candidatus Micrarchaeota archaeon]
MNNGVFFSLLAISMILLVFYYNEAYSNAVQSQAEQLSLRLQGAEFYNFVDGADDDLPRILDISGRRAVIAAVSEVVSNGVALADSEQSIRELMVNGSLQSEQVELMEKANFGYWSDSVESMGELRGFNSSIELIELNVKQLDAFHLKFNTSLQVNASDYRGTMNYSRTMYAEDVVNLQGFEDPLIPLNTRGLTKKPVTPAPRYFNRVNEVDAAIQNNYYVESTNGPSFLDRLEGKLLASASHAHAENASIGMESVLYLPGMQAQGIKVKESQTIVDYLYFNETETRGYPVLNSTYPWLKLDQETALNYNVSLNLSG